MRRRNIRVNWCIRNDHAPLVAPLLAPRRPATVSGLIMAVIVNAIAAVQPRRAAPHVSEEILIAGAPALANLDAASAIAVVSVARRVFASLNDARPDLIFGSP